MDILELYLKHIKQQVSEDDFWRIKGETKITYAEYNDIFKDFQFRFETTLYHSSFPVCQYVRVNSEGEMIFRKTGQWFVPTGNDVLFNSFAEAKRYAEQFRNIDS